MHHEILAAAALLFEPSFGSQHSTFDLLTVIRSKSIEGWRRQVLAHQENARMTALWKGVAATWVRAGNLA